MKLIKQKNPLVVLSLIALFLCAPLLAPVSVGAGDPNLTDPTLAFCHNPSTGVAQTIDLSKTQGTGNTPAGEVCTSGGGKVIKGGEQLPFPICVANGNAAQIKNDSGRTACTGTGGYIVESGGTMPKLNAPANMAEGPDSGESTVDCSAQAEGGTSQCEVAMDCKGGDLSEENCGIVRYLKIIINVLSGMVGVAVIGVLVIGGIQYSTSAGDPQAAAAAKKRISNAILALVAFGLMYGFLQWVVPGGAL